MKIILTILLFFFFQSQATIYYISNAGSDAANGLTTGTAWQTVSKVNSVTFNPGDQILFKKGDSWNERLNPPSSGTTGNVITFSSYGNGADPIITGFQALSFSDQGSNIWQATFASSVNYQNTVYLNGAIRAKGRYPNPNTATGGYLTFTSHSGTSQITGGLTGTPNYTGGEVVIRNNSFTTDHLYITSQSSGTINFSPSTYYALVDGWGYFIQNIPSVLDTLNEWAYDTTTKIIKVYATSLPTGKASSIDTLLYINGKSYITFDGIDFEGANVAAINVSNSDHITITNCGIENNGANGIEGKLSNFVTVSNNTINKCWNAGIMMIDFSTAFADSDDGLITGNTVTNTGTAAGMGKNRFQTYSGIEWFGDRTTINNNVVTNTGYIPIYFSGDSCYVMYNYVDSFCNVKDDGGGIYSWNGYGLNTGGLVSSNIVRNGLGAIPGSTESIAAVHGIYMDELCTGITIYSNTVQTTALYGIFIHNANLINIRANTVIGGLAQLGAVIVPAAVSNIDVKSNIFYTGQSTYALASISNKLYFSAMDSNYYSNTADLNHIIQTSPFYSLAAWQAFSGFDLNSTQTPAGVTATAPILKYNASATGVTYPITGSYIEMNGNVFTNYVYVAPYQSRLLFKLTNNVPPRLQNLNIRRVVD